MKRIAIASVVIVIVGLGGIALSNNQIVYETKEKLVTVEKEVSTLQNKIDDALQANAEDIEAEAQAAYNATKRQAELEIELEVTSAFRGELEEREKVLQASSTAY